MNTANVDIALKCAYVYPSD